MKILLNFSNQYLQFKIEYFIFVYVHIFEYQLMFAFSSINTLKTNAAKIIIEKGG